ncbi:MAG: DUF1566 domain-containing protein [Gammaproteobacteria bacterium]
MFRQQIIIFLLLCFLPVTYSQADSNSCISLGSTRDGGGIVFFLDSSYSHGLEAKRADEPGVFKWDAAIAAASAYGADWHLPTQNELNLLYQQKTITGNFSGFYWSSTEQGSRHAWSRYFGLIGFQVGLTKDYALRVRAVRAF